MTIDLATQFQGKTPEEIAVFFSTQVEEGKMTKEQSLLYVKKLQEKGIITVETSSSLEKDLKAMFKGEKDKPTIPVPTFDLSKLDSEYSSEWQQLAKRLKEQGFFSRYDDLTKLSADDIGFLCILLTQKSKEELIATLKEALKTAVKERAALSDKYTAEQLKVQQEQKELQDRQLTLNIIFDCIAIGAAIIGAIATTVICGAIIAGTSGIGTVFAGFAIAFAWAAVAATIASVGFKYGAMYAEDPNLKTALTVCQWVSFGAAFVFGIASAACSLGASGFSAVGGLAGLGAKLASEGFWATLKIFFTTSPSLLSALSMIVSGAGQVGSGINTIVSSVEQHKLDTMKMELEKMNFHIEFLEKLIEFFMKNSKELLQLFLKSEEMASDEIARMSGIKQELAGDIPHHA